MKKMKRKLYQIPCGDQTLELGKSTLIMGIVNVTPDSFSDGGDFLDTGAAVAQGEKLVSQGAHLIDIGGESTRPFSDPVPEQEEIRRVIPVIRELARRIPVPISIDTTKAGVARSAIDAGATIINDISALRSDPDMINAVRETGAALIVMHMKGTPKTMQMAPEYDDVMGEITDFLKTTIEKAQQAGISSDRIIVDPGIGFGKTVTHNLSILNNLDALNALDAPILVGSSRKSFLRKLIKPESVEDIAPKLPEVETATLASVAAAVMNGAHIVRVHDVTGTRICLTIIDAILNSDG